MNLIYLKIFFLKYYGFALFKSVCDPHLNVIPVNFSVKDEFASVNLQINFSDMKNNL